MSQLAQATLQPQQQATSDSLIRSNVLQRTAITPVHSPTLQRCSNGVECPECRQKRLEREGTLQRAAVNSAPTNGVPPIVHDVLNSPGQALDAGTRAFMEPRIGHDFSQISVATSTPVAHQRNLTVGEVGDTYEREADSIADTIMRMPDPASITAQSIGSAPMGELRRAPDSEEEKNLKPGPKPDNYDEAADNVAEALMKTDAGKKIVELVTKQGEEFLAHPEGKVIAGTAAAGVPAALIATKSPLPAQIPELPLNFIKPGLSARLTYKGPVDKPTDIALTFSFTPESESKKTTDKNEEYRAETARMREEQEKFRRDSLTPEQRAKEDAEIYYLLKRRPSPGNILQTPSLGTRSILQPKRDKQDGNETLMRREGNAASSPSTSSAVPSIVHDVLNSPGQPLDAGARAFMEPRFGHDFSRVRVHTDARAAESAQSVNALAYTVGRDVVFGTGQYALGTGEGRRLLAHELTHVVQQETVVSRPAFLSLTAQGDAYEQEAHHNAQAIEQGLPATAQTSSRPVLARRNAPPQVVRPPVQRPMVETQASSSVGSAPQMLEPSQRQAIEYSIRQDIYQMYKRDTEEPNPDAVRRKLEIPIATLVRGGTPPTFITASLKEKISISSNALGKLGNIDVKYIPHWFHILDAIEYDVARVNSASELIGVYSVYFPDSLLNSAQVPAPSLEETNAVSQTALRKQKFPGVLFSPYIIDPGGAERMSTFIAAGQRNPKVSQLLKQFIRQPHELPAKPEDLFSGPCQAREVSRSLSDHDHYAQYVTGSDFEYHINAPNGIHCRSDGRDSKNHLLLWEVKTRHDWASEAGLSSGLIHGEYFNKHRIFYIEAQRANCVKACKRCGYSYAYAFEDETVADFVRHHWGNEPPVHFIKRP